MKYQVIVEMKEGVLDPEMSTLQRHLQRSGEGSVGEIHRKFVYEFEVQESNPEKALERARHLAEEVLSNPEIHRWTITKKGKSSLSLCPKGENQRIRKMKRI